MRLLLLLFRSCSKLGHFKLDITIRYSNALKHFLSIPSYNKRQFDSANNKKKHAALANNKQILQCLKTKPSALEIAPFKTHNNIT